MKIFSLRNLLILGVLILVVANIFSWKKAKAEEAIEAKEIKKREEMAAGGANMFPSASNLLAMGVQWKDRLQSLPPDQRKKAEEKYQQEKLFFVSMLRLTPEERHAKITEHLQELMNDPGMQAEWAEGRHAMLASMDANKRHQMFKHYVQEKKQAKQ